MGNKIFNDQLHCLNLPVCPHLSQDIPTVYRSTDPMYNHSGAKVSQLSTNHLTPWKMPLLFKCVTSLRNNARKTIHQLCSIRYKFIKIQKEDCIVWMPILLYYYYVVVVGCSPNYKEGRIWSWLQWFFNITAKPRELIVTSDFWIKVQIKHALLIQWIEYIPFQNCFEHLEYSVWNKNDSREFVL